LGTNSEDKAMEKRYLHQRHMEEREMEIERNLQNTERIRKEREQV